MNTTNPTTQEIGVFIDYCQEFYDRNRTNSLYPFADSAEIARAVLEYLQSTTIPFDGDSIDRENVRDIICANRKKENTGTHDFDKAVKETQKERNK